MQALKMTIFGSFWDDQIYRGNLFLFERDGTITTLDWNHLIFDWSLPEPLKLPMDCAFRMGSYLYGLNMSRFLSDTEIFSIMSNKFSALLEMELSINLEDLIYKPYFKRQSNKFPFPHYDSLIYRDRLFSSSSKGIFSSRCGTGTKLPVSTKCVEVIDVPAVSMAAKYLCLALAAADNGLFEFNLGDGWQSKKLTNLSTLNCISCSWMYHSIFGGSFESAGGILASYKKMKSEDEEERDYRELESLTTAKEIFDRSSFTWGLQDKLCQLIPGGINIKRYNPWAKEKSEQLSDMGTFESGINSKDLVSATVATFGVIIETHDSLTVLKSDGNILRIEGEPVSWRIFPNSIDYLNQLHVVYKDRLEIWSFNHDYFINQEKKLLGVLHK